MGHTAEQIQEWVSQNVMVGGAFIFLLLTISLPLVTPSFQSSKMFNIFLLGLIGTTTSMLGWGIGILLSPIGSQIKMAAGLTAAFTSFWTGVVVSHIQSIAHTAMGFTHEPIGQATEVRLLMGAGTFLMALFATVNSRFSGDPKAATTIEPLSPIIAEIAK